MSKVDVEVYAGRSKAPSELLPGAGADSLLEGETGHDHHLPPKSPISPVATGTEAGPGGSPSTSVHICSGEATLTPALQCVQPKVWGCSWAPTTGGGQLCPDMPF